ncbi:MAG: 1-acyl-sn-glycerol-3-phosphate acyltransferase [Deltaproteobacteria bacterium]|nr:1-acyl-sn-glycerol-3-phosphate acyltransferase [Deltaproteobacteria bacterium]
MTDRPGWVLRRLIWPLFAPIAFGAEVVASLKQAAARGPIVYVLRSVSYVDFAYFNYAFLRFGLPLARFVNGLWTWLFATLPAVARALWRRRRGGTQEEELRGAVASGEASMLFLRQPLWIARSGGAEFRGQLVETLIAEQRAHPERRVQLAPLMLAWGRGMTRPGGPRPSFLDRIFGAQEEPGWLRSLLQFIYYRGSALVKAAATIELQTFLEENAGVRDDVLARRLRFELSGRIERERRVLLGPPRKSGRRICAELLRSRELREAVAAESERGGLPVAQLEARAARLLGEIAADMKPWAIGLLKQLLKIVFHRIYDGIDMDLAGIAKVREAARRGPFILCPCHRSHVDYLVLSYVFHDYELVPPHIAAGVNMSFFPAGQIFRRSGAFFLRRTFKGDPLYAAVFDMYMRKLLREGYNIEFFIEGTRSRTGKFLPPKTGLLRSFADAVLSGQTSGVQVVPISIGYEKVIEERSYAEELAGAKKKAENAGALLRAGRVLGARYGRLDIEIDDPFELLSAIRAAGAAPGCDEETLKTAVRRVAHRIVYRISRVTAITPTSLVAAALLASGRRGITREDLIATCGLLAKRARHHGARFEATVNDPDGPHGLHVEALDRALDLLGKDRHVDARGVRGEEIYVIPDEQRGSLDYYRNNTLHYWVDESLLAIAVLVGRCPRAELRERVLELSRLLKFEFIYRQDGFARVFDETLADLVAAGWLAECDGVVGPTPAGLGPLGLVAGLTRHFVEAYHCLARSLRVLRQARHTEREAVRHIHTQGERLFLTGEISRREACSRLIYANALRAFVDLGWLVSEDDELRVADGLDVNGVAARLARYLQAGLGAGA